MKIFILGCNGMLGHKLFTFMLLNTSHSITGVCRQRSQSLAVYDEHIIEGYDFREFDQLESLLNSLQPDVVINCAGIIKQHDRIENIQDAILINALLPHKLVNCCNKNNAKLIHFSTDCVFLGTKGGYSEIAIPDSYDVYGTTKMLGEIRDSKHLTLRTSIIGHELESSISLVDWFLAQEIPILGFRKAIFSGLPSIYIAELLTNNILENHNIFGLRNLAVQPINKFLLLSKIANFYNVDIPITPDDSIEIDRSLDGSSLFKDIGLIYPSWDDLIAKMHSDFQNSNLYG